MSYEQIPVTMLASGRELFLPLHRLEGRASGPDAWAVGGGARRRAADQRDRAARAGAQSIWPSCGARSWPCRWPIRSAFESLTRHTPIDQLDMNRNFPGSPTGWLSEQIAHVLTHAVRRAAGRAPGPAHRGRFPTVDYVYIFDKSRELSLAFGSTFLFEPAQPYQGTFAVPAAARGIPFFTAEVGGGSFLDAHYIEHGVRGVLNVLKQLGMIEGEPIRPAVQTIVTEMAVIRPRVGGVLYPEIGLDQLGQEVQRRHAARARRLAVYLRNPRERSAPRTSAAS